MTVPRADVDLGKLPGGGVSQASPDIVVTDAERAPDAASAPIIADITVKLGAGEKLDMDLRQGQEVHLVGFGLNGYLGGQLAVQDYPGRAVDRPRPDRRQRNVQGVRAGSRRSTPAACCSPARRSTIPASTSARRAASPIRM